MRTSGGTLYSGLKLVTTSASYYFKDNEKEKTENLNDKKT